MPSRNNKYLAVSIAVLMNLSPAYAAPEDGFEPLGENSAISLKIYDSDSILSLNKLNYRLRTVDFICIGEAHDSEPDHVVQLLLVQKLFERTKNLGVGLEMFESPFQEGLDKYLRSEINDEELRKQSEHEKRWNYDWQLIKPLLAFCRQENIPIVALNAPRELTRRVAKVGYEHLTPAEKEQLGEIDFDVPAHRKQWFEILGKLHNKDSVDAAQQERTYQVMAIWDDYMARRAARFKADRKLDKLVIIAGSGHIDGGFGIPDRVAKYGQGRSASIRLVTSGETKERSQPFGDLHTDYVIEVSTVQRAADSND